MTAPALGVCCQCKAGGLVLQWPHRGHDQAERQRTRHSYLVNLDHVEQIVRDEGRVTPKLRHEETELPVSRSSVPRVLQRLGLGES